MTRPSGGRFDDPAGRIGVAEARRFRAIYCASERVTALAESIIQFRGVVDETEGKPAKERPAALQEVIRRNPELQRAVDRVPRDWLARRTIGVAALGPTLPFVDLKHQETLRYVRQQLGEFAASLGIQRIDYGVLLGANRQFTQALAGHFYEQINQQTDEPLFAGIRYVSSLGLDWECWAVFDQRCRPEPLTIGIVDPADADLAEAARLLNLEVGI